MPKWVADEKIKKKKEEEKKAGSNIKSQSSSVENRAKNSTFMGGGSSVRKTEERVKGPSEQKRQQIKENTTRRTETTTAAQRQKMGMPTQQDLESGRQHRQQLRTSVSNAVKQATSEENKGFMQRQKSGTQTEADKRRTQQMTQRRTEVARNTRAAAVKAVKDTGSGYAQSLYDLSELTASNRNGTIAKAMKMGLDPERDKRQMAELERERKYTAEESKRRRDELFEKQEQRQAEWDERTKNAKGLEKAWYGAVESGTGMVADTLVGAATGTGQFGALASMGLRTYGSSANQARKEGATDKEARLYGAAQSVKEMGTELMFQGAGLAKAAYGKTGLSLADKAANTLTKGLTGIKADVVGAGVRALGGTAEENVEELAGWMADPLIKELTYGKAVRNRMKENLRANIPQIGSDADAANVASYFSTPQFTDELTSEYIRSGMSKEKASELAAEMRDYYVAYYSGDQARLDALEEDLAAKLSGQDKLSLKSWSMDELKDTFASTTLLTLATGMPGAVTTSVKGNQIFDSDEVKAVFGNDAVRKVADAVKNTSNKEMSLKAETMKDRLDSGKDLTGTQKFDLYQGYLEKVNETAKKARASYGVAENAREEQDLVPTMGVDRAGNRIYNKETQKEFNEKFASTELTVEAIKNYMESDNSISDDESRRANAVKKAVADLHVGGLTVGDAHEFAYGNDLAREALKAEEGIDLDQYVVRNSDGTVNLPATNEATENALFQINADNAIKSAQAETEVFIDDTRGNIDKDLLTRFGNSGQAVWKEVNKNLDPRDLQNYLTTANAASYFYSAGRNTDMSVDTAINRYADTFKTVDNSVLKRAFAAGARDRIIANTPGYGQAVEAGSNIQLKKTKPIITGQLIMDKDVVIPDSDQSAYLALAMSTNTNIHIVSSLQSKQGVEINGMSHGNDIYLNMNAAAESNLGYVFMHEMTHQVKQYAPNEYLALENLVRDRWFNKDAAGMQKAIKDRIDLYSTKGGQQLTEEEAVEEIIADAMAEAMDDPEFAAQVCEEDINLGQAILNSIRAALRSIRQMFANIENPNDRFHNSLLSYLGILDEAEKMWLNALATARKNKADGLIADWQDRANKQNAPRLSVGYHAGDLGKSTVDDYAHQGGSRGTGHFGFGTYFVGNEEQINYGNYGKRKHETVDFDKYNLFEPRDFDQGIKLHDALRTIDGIITDYSDFMKYKDSIFNEALWEDEMYRTTHVNTDIERLVDDYEMDGEPDPKRKEKIDKFISEMPEYYRENIEREAQKKYDEAQNREIDEDNIRDYLKQRYELWGSARYDNLEDYVENNLEREIRYINSEKEVPYEQWYYEAAKDAISEYSEDWDREKKTLTRLADDLQRALNYKHSKSKIEAALLKTEEIVKGYQPEGGYRLDAEPGLDSGATVFMKQLGYEGVDVRHIPEMDNTGYGSVIYDLKGEDLARKQEIGTARFSISANLDEPYMDAVNSGNMDEAQRLVDEAAKSAGYTMKAYHGTTTNFNVFSRARWGENHDGYMEFGAGFYFTPSENEAKSWAERGRNGMVGNAKAQVMSVYLNADRVINADDPIPGGIKVLRTFGLGEADANFIANRTYRFINYLIEDKGFDNVEVQDELKYLGYDAVDATYGFGKKGQFVVFNPEQIKSADPVTYAEDGSVIPLSERFDPTNNDIRYSMPTQDSDGNILTDGQMEYFKNSQARDAEGKMQVVYHTTNHGGFTIFDPSYSDDKRSLFFASNWAVSQTYGSGWGSNRRINLDIDRTKFESFEDFENAIRSRLQKAGLYELGIATSKRLNIQIRRKDDGEIAYELGRNAEDRFRKWLELAKDSKEGEYEFSMDSLGWIPGFVSQKGRVKASSYSELMDYLYDMQTGADDTTNLKGYYSCYLNLENPLIVDAKGQNWNNISYGEYNDNAALVINNLVVQDMGDSIYVNIWGERKVGEEWQEFRESDTIDAKYDPDEETISNETWDRVYDFMIAQGLSDEVADYYAGSFFDFTGLKTYDKDGKEIESDIKRYKTRDLASLAESRGHDGVIIRNLMDIGGASSLIGGNALSDIYIAFSSNQVKDINNENPTENPDIRYSITPEDEAMSKMANDFAFDNSYERLAYYETIIDENISEEAAYEKAKKYIAKDIDEFYAGLTRYADGMRFDDPVLEEGRVRMAKSKQDYFNSNVAKWNQNWLTEGEVLDIESVKKPIKDLVMANMMDSNTSKRYKADLVKKMAIDMRLAYYYAKQGRTDVADALLWHSAFRMVDGVEFYADDGNYETYKILRDYFRNNNIQLGEEYWSDTDYAAFRKANYGRINLVRGKTNLDKVLDDLYHENPDGSVEGIAVEWFNPEAFEKNDHKIDSVPDILLQIADVLDDVEPYAEAYSSDYCAEWATDLASSLLDIMANGKELQSTADKYRNRYEAKVKAMKARHAEAMLKVRQQKEAAVRKEKVRLKEYVEKKKEQQAHKTYFDRIKETYDSLVERLSSNTADKHIPEQYKKELAKLLAAFDLQTVGSKARQARTGHIAKNTIRMAAIKEALKSIEDRTEMFHVNDAITDLMDELSSVEGKTIDSLSAAELWNIDRLLRSLLHEFNRYEKVRIGAKNLQAADLADAQVYSALEHAKIFGPGNDYRGPRGWIDQIVNMDEMTPAYLFKRIDPDNVGLGLMWKEIRRSQDKYIRNTEQINKWMEEITGKYKNKGRFGKKYGSDEIEKWRSSNYITTFELENGTVNLTPAQMMSLYCLSKRNQAYGHMVGAGIVVAPVSFQAKIMSDLKQKINRSLPVILTDADIKNVVSQLTPEQVQVADKLQELMSTKMADLGNEASMNVLGIKLFNESDYFPIKSDKAALERDLTNEQFENAIRNFGFTKAVQPGARNAIMIEDIFDVVTEHCNNMNLYNSYSETLNDFMKVFNKHSIQENGADYSVRQALAHAYSQKATTFIMEFIRDLNGNTSRGRTTGIETAMNDMLSNAKKASVFANLRVLAQQPTAITRAFAVISPKYLKGVNLGDALKGMIPTVTTKDMQEMFDHCPIALWKSWGYYDINMGKSIESVIMNEGNWLEDMATQAYGKADNITWTAIWQMVKAETKDLHPELKEGTDEYWEHCNERMSEIVDFTQVVDSPLHRSHAMRAKDILHKTTTSFMAEPTLTFNMIRDGWIRAREAWIKGDKSEAAKILGKTASVAGLQAATVAAAAAVVDALRGKNPGGGDGDEDKSLWLINFLNNLKDEMKIWNKIYYIKDLASIAEGWDNANLALQGWKTLVDGFKQFDKKTFEGSKVPWWKIYYNLLGGIGYFTGIPFKTLMKDGRAIFELLGGELPESLVGDEKSSGVVSSDSKLQSLRVFKSSNTNKTSTSTSAVKVDIGEKWYDYENNPITVKDGSTLDKLLNHFGINLTASEKAQIAASQAQQERDSKAEEIKGKYADLNGDERDKKVWSAVTTYYKSESEDSKAFADMVTSGEYGDINEMKQMYIAAGGGEEYFDERVLAESKKALKKSIKYDQTDAELDAQERIKDYVLNHGMTEDELSDIVYHSETAKDLKVAFRLNDKDLMMESLEPLVNAGLTYSDLQRLWDNRNRMQLSSYKGRYKDKLKSTGKFIWPTEGVITSHFGYRNAPTAGASSNHPAIDIGAPQGTAVVAADGGIVISAGANGGYGNSVGIKHDNGMITWYNHLYSWNVKEGDTVAQGQQIAQVGSTGISTGPHLDFKIMDTNGDPVDPEKYLAAR